MDFTLVNIKDSISEVARQIGYLIIDTRENGEYNLVRKIYADHYPRFHIYARQAGDRLIVSLHLDQKKPSYEGSHAHGGDYDGPVVENEAERVRSVLSTKGTTKKVVDNPESHGSGWEN